MKLLTLGNPKTAKATKFGYLNAVLHLAPAKLAKRKNVCQFASPGCLKACLNTAGRGGICKAGTNTNRIQEARIRKTQLFYDNPAQFASDLLSDIDELRSLADKLKLEPALRLNGTSDIDWGNVGFGVDLFSFIDDRDIELYDYTKDFDRAVAYYGNPWYHLTFSRSEINDDQVNMALQKGINVAVVFRDKLPPTWRGVTVIDGDLHDLRFLDRGGVVVGLLAKGKAKKDTTGFVV